MPMRLAIAKGHGSALLTGLEELQEQEVRAIESEVGIASQTIPRRGLRWH